MGIASTELHLLLERFLMERFKIPKEDASVPATKSKRGAESDVLMEDGRGVDWEWKVTFKK